jgi:hypothetical protein
MHFTVAGTTLRRLFAASGLLVAATLPASVMANTFLRMQTDLGGAADGRKFPELCKSR